jgi:dTDP-4-amino-4,6-dideoxygalactose transaminase
LLLPKKETEATSAFEQAFAEYVGCRHAIAVASGRLAMHLILEACDARPGDEALVPAFNLFAVIERFCQLGVSPRFCDIRREDLNIDPDDVEEKITPRTRFLLATHMFGHPADVTRLADIAQRHGLTLLEDCAHAMGSQWGGRMVGTFGRASIFSFSVLKLVTTFGGGMIATNDDRIAQRIRQRLTRAPSAGSFAVGLKKAITGSIMDFGTRGPVFSLGAWPALRVLRSLRPGFQREMMTESPRIDRNFRPDAVPPLHPFQSRLGLSQLAQVEQWISKRREVGRWLDHELRDTAEVRLLESHANARHNGLYYGILAERSNELAEHLFRQGIDCVTSEYRDCAGLEMYREHFAECPVSREVETKILRLPNHPSLNRSKVQRIGRAIRAFYKSPQ